MKNHDSEDPLEGKGEEMIPDRGIPFDDIEESASEEASPLEGDEQLSFLEGEEIIEEVASLENFDPESELRHEFEESESFLEAEIESEQAEFPGEAEMSEPLSNEAVGFTPLTGESETDAWESEAQPALLGEAELSPEATPEGETKIPFDILPEEDVRPEGLSGDFGEVPHPWEASSEEVERWIGDAEAAFAPSPGFEASLIDGEVPSFLGLTDDDQPPDGFPDEGMGTALEESAYMGESPPESMAIPEPGSMSGAPLFSEAAFAEPGPIASHPGGKVPQQDEEQTARDEMLKLLVTEDVIQDLWQRTDDARNQVLDQVHNLPIGRQMLDHIQAARNELMGGPENYEEAERFINEVDYRISLSQRLAQWSKGFIALLYFYEIAWAAILLIILILYLGENAFASAQAQGTSILTYLIGSMIWGGFGGVIGAMLSIIKHIAQEQDFDQQYTWWYINSPIIGIATGAFIFLIMQGGLLSITGSVNSITSPIVIYILAGLAGYQQNVFTDLIKRLIKVFEIEGKKEPVDQSPEIKTSKSAETEAGPKKKEEAEQIPG